MNAKYFLENIEKLLDVPGALPRLKQLIFELAVRGAFSVDQLTPSEWPEQNLKGSDNSPFPIPSHWRWMRLKDIGTLSGGMTPSKAKSEYWDGNVNWFSPKDIKSDELFSSELKITRLAVSETSLQMYPPNSIVIVARSGILKRTLPVAILKEYATVNQDIKVLRPFVADMENYIQLMLRGMTEYVLEHLVKTGTTVQSLKFDEFENQVFPVPPIDEQIQIVNTVKSLLQSCNELQLAKIKKEETADALLFSIYQQIISQNEKNNDSNLAHLKESLSSISNLNRFITTVKHIKIIKKIILCMAVRGELTREQDSDEPVSFLLQRIKEYRENFSKALNDSAHNDSSPESRVAHFYTPSHWTWKSFGEVVVSRDGERVPVSKENRNELSKIYDYYGASGVIDKVDNYIFDKPLLLIGEDGANLLSRSSPIAFIARGNYWVNNHAHVLDAESETLLKYLEIYINSIDLAPYVTGSAQPKLNQKNMNRIPVPLPSIDEQSRIIKKVDHLTEICNQLEEQIITRDEEKQRFLKSVVQDVIGQRAELVTSADETPLVRDENVLVKNPTPHRLASPHTKTTSFKVVESVDELLNILELLGGEATPAKLLHESGISDIEKFFDLLREGRNLGSLLVPTGKDKIISRSNNAN